MKKHLGFLFNLIAIALFIPGITLPMMTLSMDVFAKMSGGELSSTLLDKELSLLATIQELWQDERLFVAALIFLFSICIPLLKTVLMTAVYFINNMALAKRIADFVSLISKWSMADVFVVAVFLAILSTNQAETVSEQQINIFAFKINFTFSSETFSAAGPGFYYFVGYCLLAILATQLSRSALNDTSKKGTK